MSDAGLAITDVSPAAHASEQLPPLPPPGAFEPSPFVPPAPARVSSGVMPCFGDCDANRERFSDRRYGATPTPLDRAYVTAALSAVSIAHCRQADGPRGAGHIVLTFSPDGRIDEARLDQGRYAGTPAGECILAAYSSVRVPAFGGGPIRVGRSFVL